MAGRSPVVAREEQRHELLTLSQSRERGEADRARALLLTLAGWTSPRIAEAFGVREDTVRLWRSDFMRGGVAALRRSLAPGPAPIKAERALEVAEALLAAPAAGRPRRGRRRSRPSALWRWPRRFCPRPWRTVRTGRCRAWPTRSRSARGFASRRRGCPWCCAKKGFRLAACAPHPEGPAGCRCCGPRRAWPQAAQGAGRGR